MAKESTAKGSIFGKILRQLASFSVAVVLLAFLLLITYLGTEEQPSQGLFLTKKKYFESWFLLHREGFPIPWFGSPGRIFPLKGVPLPLPGGQLLMFLFALNLLAGGLLRIRKNWKTIGVVIAHFSIFYMLLAGLVTYYFGVEGNLPLYEGQTGNTFSSYHDWVVEVQEVKEGERKAWIIGESHINALKPEDSRDFVSEGYPFKVTLSNHAVNCEPLPESYRKRHERPVKDGYFLREREREAEGERNVGGVYVKVHGGGNSSIAETILTGFDKHPFTFEHEGKTWALKMGRRTWQMPFDIRLDKFIKEEHPGTMTPRVFKSEVTKIEDKNEQNVKIEMNKPLRHRGYTLFQASWGPENARPGEKLYSVFAVWRNPADQWPLYACIMAAVGLLIHFGFKLFQYLSKSKKKVTS